MKKMFTSALLTLMTMAAQAQFSVLFIDDTGDAFGNAELLASTLDSLGYDYLYVDAIGTGVTPPAAEMAEYDLVIWHTSSWGAGLQLWGGDDSENTALKTYLAMPDAKLWLIGLDFLYDKYGAAPVTFAANDFPYDYLGISKYATQSFADDGGLGVPLVTPVAGQPIPGIGDIDWVFSTLWYADGVQARPEAVPVYAFGGTGYNLAGSPAGVYYERPGAAKVLTYTFDLSLASGFPLMRTHVGQVLDWWESQTSKANEPGVNAASVAIHPNIVYDQLTVQVTPQVTGVLQVQLCDMAGKVVGESRSAEAAAGVPETIVWNNLGNIPSGIYQCQVMSGGMVTTSRWVKR